MPESQILQNAFNAGELSPSLLGRGDVPAYKAGAKQIQNWIVRKPGGLQRRPGSRYVNAHADETQKAYLYPFAFSETTQFMLEWTPNRLRIYQDRSLLNLIEHLFTGGNQMLIDTSQCEVKNHGYPDDLEVVFTQPAGTTIATGLGAGIDYTIKRAPAFSDISQPAAVDVGTNTITIGTNDLSDGMGPYRVSSTATLPTNLSASTDYYIRFPTPSTVQLATTTTGSPVNIGATGSGYLSLTPTDAYLRNFFRVYQAGALVVFTDTGVGAFTVKPKVTTAIDLDTPFAAAQVASLQIAQDKDLMVIASDGTVPLQVLRRYADHAWELTEAEYTDGPYLGIQVPTGSDPDTELNATLATKTGSNVELTMSKPTFRQGDIGRSVRFGDPAGDKSLDWGWGVITGVPEPSFTSVAFSDKDSTGGTIDATAGVYTLAFSTDHNFSNGEGPVRIDVSGNGLSASTDYWLQVLSSTTVTFHTSRAAALADTGRVTLTAGAPTFDVTSSTINIASHGFTDKDGPVRLINDQVPMALPPNFFSTVDYYIRVLDVNRFGLALTPSGDAIAPDSAGGTGTHTITGAQVLLDTALVDIRREAPQQTMLSEWRLGAFSDRDDVGHPQAVTFHEQRLVLAGAPGTPQTLYGSQTGQIFDFGPDEDDGTVAADYTRVITDASGYTFALRSRDLNAITWLESIRILLCGTSGGVFSVSATTYGEALTSGNVNARKGTRVGAAANSPGVLGTFLAFIEASGSVLSQAEYQPSTESIETRDLMDLAAHLSEGFTFTQLAVTLNPMPAFWVVRSDGTLLTLTFDPAQNVGAWARQKLGGTDTEVESVAVLENAFGGEVWLSVKRTINGSTHRYIEILGDRFYETKAHAEAELTDSSIFYDGAPTTTITGLAHLEGERVEILADGATHDPQTVSGGSITLQEAASKVRVGLGYTSILQHLPPEVDARRGNPVISLSTTRAVQAMIRVNRTGALKAGADIDNLHEFPFRDVDDLMDNPAPLFTGVLELVPNSPTNRDQTLYVVAEGPQPAEILSTYQRVEFSTR